MNTVSIRFLLPAFAAVAAFAAEPAARPNLIYILADDLGYGDLACYNPDSKIPTPHLDRLAREGTRFTDAHSPSSVCTPTRYALVTGRYAWRTHLQRGVLGPWERPLIAPGRLTVASLLRQHGYATACIGKWHLGWTWPTRDGALPESTTNRLSNVDFSRPMADGPVTRGFEYYFGVDVPNFPPYCFIENDRTVGRPIVPDTGRAGGFNRPGPMLPGWKLDEVLPELTRRAVAWIKRAAGSSRPFFLYLPLTSPHYPVVPSPAFKGKSQAGDYGDFVAQTDWTVGQILAALEQSGAAGRTLVIFTSDNGPEITGEVNPGVYDRIVRYGHRSTGSLRGAKRDLWEGGHRVPFIARWPGSIPPDATSGETMCQVDLLATVAAILGTTLPPDAGEDSVNVLPALLGRKRDQPARATTVHHAANGRLALRRGDWVFIDAPSGEANNAARGEPAWFKQEHDYTAHTQPAELFDLHTDPQQRRNLFTAQPVLAREMKEMLERCKRDGRTTPGPPQPNDLPYDAGPLPKAKSKKRI